LGELLPYMSDHLGFEFSKLGFYRLHYSLDTRMQSDGRGVQTLALGVDKAQ